MKSYVHISYLSGEWSLNITLFEGEKVVNHKVIYRDRLHELLDVAATLQLQIDNEDELPLKLYLRMGA